MTVNRSSFDQKRERQEKYLNENKMGDMIQNPQNIPLTLKRLVNAR